MAGYAYRSLIKKLKRPQRLLWSPGKPFSVESLPAAISWRSGVPPVFLLGSKPPRICRWALLISKTVFTRLYNWGSTYF